MSHERLEIAGAEVVATAEGNMCGAAMRGADALPGSEATSRTNGSRRNLGDLMPPAVASAIPGRDRKSRRRSCRGRREASDGRTVPMKPRTKPTSNRWRRVWREGGRSEGTRAATHAPDSAPDFACHRSREPTGPSWRGYKARCRATSDLRQEPDAGKPHAGICGGGAEKLAPLPDVRQAKLA